LVLVRGSRGSGRAADGGGQIWTLSGAATLAVAGRLV